MPRAVHPRQVLHPQRYQAGQLLDGRGPSRLYRARHRFRSVQEVQRFQHAPSHPIQREQVPDRYSQIRQCKYTPGYRTEQKRRPGVPRIHADIFLQGIPTMARFEGHHQETKIRPYPGEETVH